MATRFAELFRECWEAGQCSPLYAGIKGSAGAWTNGPFQKAMAADSDALRLGRSRAGFTRVEVKESRLRGWKAGNHLPREAAMLAMLDIFYGDAPGHAAARAEMRAAWEKKRPEVEIPDALEAAMEPSGLPMEARDKAVRVVRDPALDDEEAAVRPETAERHAMAREQLANLAGSLARQHNMLSPGWGELLPAVRGLEAVLAAETSALADALQPLYQRTLQVVAHLDQDDDYRRRPEEGEAPLPAALRRLLSTASAAIIALARAFPGVRAQEAEFGEFRTPPDARVAEVAFGIIEASGALSREDAELIRILRNVAAMPGPQGDKARRGAFGSARNWVFTVAGTMLMGAYVNESPMMKAAGHAMARIVEVEAPALLAGLPAGVEALVREALAGGVTVDGPMAPPPHRPEQEMEPPAGFDMEEVKRMVLAGQAPPREWVPFIRELSLLSEAPFRNLVPLASLSALESLDLTGTSVSDVVPLARLTMLQDLNLAHTQVRDIIPLADLTTLRSLDLRGTNVSDVRPLARLTGLTNLYLGSTQVQDTKPLARLNNLETLDLMNSLIGDVEPLATLKQLRVLGIGGTQVSDVVPLAGLIALQALDLWHTQVRDIAPIVSLNSLQSLDLSYTDISDVAPLAHLAALRRLDLARTKIRDVTELAVVRFLRINLDEQQSIWRFQPKLLTVPEAQAELDRRHKPN